MSTERALEHAPVAQQPQRGQLHFVVDHGPEREPRPAGRAFVRLGAVVHPQAHPRRRHTQGLRQRLPFADHQLRQDAALLHAPLGQRELYIGGTDGVDVAHGCGVRRGPSERCGRGGGANPRRGTRRGRRRRHDARLTRRRGTETRTEAADRGAGEVARENLCRALALCRQLHRADDAQPDAVPGPMSRETERAAAATQVERRALDMLEPERPPDHHAQVLPADLARRQPVERQPRHPTGVVARQHPQVAQRASEAASGEGTLQVGIGELGAPHRESTAAVIVMHGQVRRIVGAWPDVRRLLAASAARRAVEHRGRRTLVEQKLRGGGQRRALGRGIRGAHHLAMGLVAEVEAIGAVPPAIRGGVGPDGDGERFQ